MIESEKIYQNVEVKKEIGREYVCREISNNDDAFGKAVVLAIAGSMIDSEHAFLGAITGLLLGEVKVRKVCYDEIQYESSIESKYVYTLIFFFQAEDGIRDAQESRGLGDVYKRQI